MVGSMQTPIIPVGSGQTQEMIAPVQDTLIAKQNYAEGQQFILGGALFTVTKSGGISVGDTINMNTDVEASDNITDQIMSMMGEGYKYTFGIKTESITIDSSSNLLFPTDRCVLSASVRFSGDNYFYPVIIQNTSSVTFSNWYLDRKGTVTKLPINTTVTVYYMCMTPITS